jgi:formate dehydrogenase accessory protein FdhD
LWRFPPYQRADDAEIAHGVEPERRCETPRRDDDTGQRRTDRTTGIDADPVGGDRGLKIPFVNELRNDRLPGGRDQRPAHPHKKGEEQQVRCGGMAEPNDRRETSGHAIVEASRPAKSVGGHLRVTPEAIAEAMEQLTLKQVLNRQTRALHAAEFWQPRKGIVAVREDVGRHNALDKLVGALALSAVDGASGVVLITSRVSVEIVQKTAALGASILVAVSAPTALAVRAAEACGMTLVGIARKRDFEVFTHMDRISAR